MALRRTLGVLAAGTAAVLAAPAFGQDIAQGGASSSLCPSSAQHAFSGFTPGQAPTPCSEPTLPPARIAPLDGAMPSQGATSEPPLAAELHLASTTLGFEQGVAPAPGHSVRYNGLKYRVTDIEVKGGGQTFSGGSAYVVGVTGSVLIVGLKVVQPGSALDPDRLDPSVVN